jgi:WD40 repeat protein
MRRILFPPHIQAVEKLSESPEPASVSLGIRSTNFFDLSGTISHWIAHGRAGRKLFQECCHDKTVKVWDTATGKERFHLKGHADRVMSVAFSPDGRRLASESWERR